MQEREGVIKFSMAFTLADPLPAAQLTQLNAWRQILVKMSLIGQTAERYSGDGFGNISTRIPSNDSDHPAESFIISGTQTGGIATLGAEHYATVTSVNGRQNTVVAHGPISPSSESMTHGILYQLDPEINWVMHVHDPHMWHRATALKLPQTSPTVPYGTPEMSAEVERLFSDRTNSGVNHKKIFSMAGHEDGIVAFGQTADEVGHILLSTLAQALALN